MIYNKKILSSFIVGVIGSILAVVNITQWNIPSIGLLFGIMAGWGITYSIVKHYLRKKENLQEDKQ